MNQQVIEGPWDEILQHAGELTGKRVRVTVLEGSPPTLDQTLLGLLEAAEQLSRSGTTHEAGTTGAWGDDVAEKFRAQGFDL